MKFEIALCGEKEPDLFSRLIMWWQGTKYSHIFVIVDEKTVYHAVERGTCFEPVEGVLDQHHECFGRVTIKPCPTTRTDDIAFGYLLGNMGRPYSVRQCIAIVFPFLRPIFKNGLRGAICSEFVAQFLQTGLGFEIVDIADLDFCSPKEVFAMAEWISRNQQGE